MRSERCCESIESAADLTTIVQFNQGDDSCVYTRRSSAKTVSQFVLTLVECSEGQSYGVSPGEKVICGGSSNVGRQAVSCASEAQ